MTNLNLKAESCLTLLGRNLRILIFIFSDFARVTSHGKICLRALTSGNPSVGEPFAVTLAANENKQQTRTS